MTSVLLVIAILGIAKCQSLSVSVYTANKYKLGEAVTCEVSITNNHEKDIYLLQRYTPLDEAMIDIFDITTEDGISLHYDGLLYQRVAPLPNEYIHIPAKSSVNSSTDLSQSYSIVSNIKCMITLTTTLIFYEEDPSNQTRQHVLSNTRNFEVISDETLSLPTHAEVLRNSAVTQKRNLTTKVGRYDYIQPKVSGIATTSDITTLLKVYDASYKILSTSYFSVDSNPRLYTTWFGSRTDGYVKSVGGVYLNVIYAMQTYQYTISFGGPQCTKIKGVIAYTYKGSQTIYLCNLYRSEPDIKGTDTKMGTIVHEFTHAAAHTDDITYGQQNCMNLAKLSPDQAVKNADNYHYFSEQLVQ